MFDNNRRKDRAAAKQKVRDRINAGFDRSKYKYIPEEKPIDYYDNEVSQRVGIYVRVSTDDVRQTTSYELQKKYYEDFVQKHPHWKLYKIYADEGISGTSTTKREAFNEMIADAKAHKIDLTFHNQYKLLCFYYSGNSFDLPIQENIQFHRTAKP